MKDKTELRDLEEICKEKLAKIQCDSNPSKKLHFVGIGGAGGNVIKAFHEMNIPADYTYIDVKSMPGLPDSIRYSRCDPTNHELFLENNKFNLFVGADDNKSINFIDIFNKDETIVIISSLSRYAGRTMSLSFFTLLLKNLFDVFWVVIYPFDYEGKDVYNFAAHTIGMMGHPKNVGIVSNQKCREEFGNLPFDVAFRKIDLLIFEKVLQLVYEKES